MTTSRFAGVVALAAVLLVSASGCVPSEPSVAPTSLAPGNEQNTKGADRTLPPIEPVLVFATVDDDLTSVSVSGYIAGVIEDGGTCTYLLATGDRHVSVENIGAADASSTACGTADIPIEQLSSGVWSVTLSYQSETTSPVVSTALNLEVP